MFFRQYFSYLKLYDWLLITPAILLVLFGLVTQYSLTLNIESPDYTFFYKQSFFLLIGLISFFILSIIDFRIFKAYAFLFYGIGIVLLLGVLIFGQTLRGTKGWYLAGPFTFQPVEIAKLTTVVALAYFFSKKFQSSYNFSTWVFSGLLVVLPSLLLLLQPDFGSTLIFLALWLGFLLIKGLRGKDWLLILVILIGLTVFLWQGVLADYQKDRLLNFFDSSRDPLGRGYNLRQSVIAVGSGRLLGRGLGLGSQSHLNFLPAAKTDFIFSAIAEELGFWGSFLVLGFFAILLLRIFKIMAKARDNFSLFLSFGLGLLFFIEIFINIGMSTGLLPIVGLPLPFLSYGGSSLLVSFISLGILESIASRQKMSI